MPSLLSQSLRYPADKLFGTWTRFFSSICVFALGMFIASFFLERQSVMDKIIVYGSGLGALAVAFVVLFLYRLAYLWCHEHDQRMLMSCPLRHVHLAAAQDESDFNKAIWWCLTDADLIQGDNGSLIRFSFLVHNGSVFTLSLAEEKGRVGSAPLLTGVVGEPIQLGQPILDTKLGDEVKHADTFSVSINVPIPDAAVARLREVVASCNRNGPGMFQFRGYVSLRVKAKESKQSSRHLRLPDISIPDANRRGLRAKMIADPRYF